MKTWIITDTHFGHRNIEKYCDRPVSFENLIFEGVKIIQPEDIIIHLGDFCFGEDEKWHELWNSSLVLNKKILIKGNHDKKSNNYYLSHGWSFVCESLSDHWYGKYITLSHEPIPNIQNLNIHGHFHNNLDRLKKKEFVVENEEERNREVLAGMNNNHKLLALEYTDYKPVLLESFIKNIKKLK